MAEAENVFSSPDSADNEQIVGARSPTFGSCSNRRSSNRCFPYLVPHVPAQGTQFSRNAGVHSSDPQHHSRGIIWTDTSVRALPTLVSTSKRVPRSRTHIGRLLSPSIRHAKVQHHRPECSFSHRAPSIDSLNFRHTIQQA